MEVLSQSICLDYDYFSAEEILRQVLPDGTDVPSSFETVGHIAHLNLRDEQVKYQKIIGEVLLDKNRHLKTVVNKTGSIDNIFRNFHYEVIAGDQDLNAEVMESGCRLQFDYGKVYWNSRLQGEHNRMIEKLRGDE